MNLRRRVNAPSSRWARQRWLPRRTVRLRLTLLYGALFLASGTVLLAVTYVLVGNATNPSRPSAVVRQRPNVQAKVALAIDQHAALMHQVLVSCGIALAVTAVLSIALGWLVAGRVLRPLRAMTAATQRITEQNLGERLAVAGPDDELKRLGDTIDDLLARLEGAFNAQRRFIANASHELRTPLTMMRTALDVATNKPQPPPPGVTVLAGKIRLGLDRADRLLESFLTLAHAQHGGALHFSRVSLDRIAAAVVTDHRDAITAMRLTVEQDHHDAPVQGSEALLTHLLDNLVDNAIRHNQPGGWVRVASAVDGEAARLLVENGGPLLAGRDILDLTQPFRRLGGERTSPAKGVGLGLSIVAAIIETHHGSLDLQARPTGGLRVTVCLPLDRNSDLAGASA
jgi:signal transduction histidine kinase